MIRAKMLATRAGRRPQGPTDMAREASYQRLVPDPSITVPKMIAMLKAFQRSRKSNDLALHLRDLKNCISWSCAMSRCIKAICELNDLFELALTLAENGMLPRAGLRDALVRLNTETDSKGDAPHRWNYTVRADFDVASELSTIIRVGLRKLRDCKKSECDYSRAVDKQDDETFDKFNSLLDNIELQNTSAAQSHVFEEVVNDVDASGLSNVFDRCLQPDFDFRPMQPAESDEAGPHCKGMAFIMSMQVDPDDGPPPPVATPRRSFSQDSICSHSSFHGFNPSQVSLKPSRSSSQASLNFDTETVYDDGYTSPALLPPVSNSSMVSVSATAPLQAAPSPTPVAAPENKTTPTKRTPATSMVTPEKHFSFVFKKSDMKPVVHLAGNAAPKPVEPAKKSMKRKPAVKAGGPVVKAVKPKRGGPVVKASGSVAKTRIEFPMQKAAAEGQSSDKAYSYGCSKCLYRKYGTPCRNNKCVKKANE